MEYEWDASKNEANILAGRPGFEAIEDFEWETAVIRRSDRHGESRWVAVGYIGDRLHYVVYTMRSERMRVISLRRASKRDEGDYAETQGNPH